MLYLSKGDYAVVVDMLSQAPPGKTPGQEGSAARSGGGVGRANVECAAGQELLVDGLQREL